MLNVVKLQDLPLIFVFILFFDWIDKVASSLLIFITRVRQAHGDLLQQPFMKPQDCNISKHVLYALITRWSDGLIQDPEIHLKKSMNSPQTVV